MGGQALATYSYTQDGYNRLDTLDYGNGDSVQYSYSGTDGSLTEDRAYLSGRQAVGQERVGISGKMVKVLA